jgi:hypothetical protein
LSAYELWLADDHTGTISDFLTWLQGENGTNGLNAYELWTSAGNEGTLEEFLASLQGTPGTNGTNGQSAWTLLTGSPAQFTQPAIGQNVVVTALNTSWLSLGEPVHLGGTPGNWYFVASISGTSLTLRNPGPADGYPDGIDTNSDPGATITDTYLTARGRDGKDGADGDPGDTGGVGPMGPGVGPVIGVPSTAPEAGEATMLLATDSPSTPTWVKFYAWNGSAWAVAADVTPKPGSKTLFLAADPNTQPTTYGNDTDVVMDTSVSGSIKVWQRTAPGTWALKGTISGGSGTSAATLFRVGKTIDQPILKGGRTATVVNFEAQSGGSLLNGGAWNGSKFTVPADLSDPTTFLLENVNITTEEGAGEAVVFTVSIDLNGTSVASGTITMTTGTTEGKLAIISHIASTLTKDDVVQVSVTPDVNPTVLWSVAHEDIVFYDQQ